MPRRSVTPKHSGCPTGAYDPGHATGIHVAPAEKSACAGGDHDVAVITLDFTLMREISPSVAVAGSQHRKTNPGPPRDLPANAAIPP
jgi:hypothetical protein